MFELKKFWKDGFNRLIGWIPDARFLLHGGGPAYSFPFDYKSTGDNTSNKQEEKLNLFNLFAIDRLM